MKEVKTKQRQWLKEPYIQRTGTVNWKPRYTEEPKPSNAVQLYNTNIYERAKYINGQRSHRNDDTQVDYIINM